jgi:hypothetical protein
MHCCFMKHAWGAAMQQQLARGVAAGVAASVWVVEVGTTSILQGALACHGSLLRL